MTYEEFRKFGYVSRLSDVLVAKGASGNISTANNIAGQQIGGASTAGAQSADSYNQFKTLLQPLIGQQTALASGDRQAALSAAMPVISKLSAGWQGAKDSIMNSLPPGASRDKALADLSTQMTTNIGGAQAGAVQQAPGILANVGSQFDQDSLQRLGAMFSGLQGGAQTNLGAGQMAAAQQKAMLDFFGGLVKSVSGLVKPLSFMGGGGSAAPPAAPGWSMSG